MSKLLVKPKAVWKVEIHHTPDGFYVEIEREHRILAESRYVDYDTDYPRNEYVAVSHQSMTRLLRALENSSAEIDSVEVYRRDSFSELSIAYTVETTF